MKHFILFKNGFNKKFNVLVVIFAIEFIFIPVISQATDSTPQEILINKTISNNKDNLNSLYDSSNSIIVDLKKEPYLKFSLAIGFGISRPFDEAVQIIGTGLEGNTKVSMYFKDTGFGIYSSIDFVGYSLTLSGISYFQIPFLTGGSYRLSFFENRIDIIFLLGIGGLVELAISGPLADSNFTFITQPEVGFSLHLLESLSIDLVFYVKMLINNGEFAPIWGIKLSSEFRIN